MSGRSESCSHKLDHLLSVCQRCRGIRFEKLGYRRPRGKGVRVAGRNVIAIQTSTRFLNGEWYRCMDFKPLAQVIKIVAHPAISEMLQSGLQGFLCRLLARKTAPCPVPSCQQVT